MNHYGNSSPATTPAQTHICKSVFKNGKTTTTESDFTNKYIELINTLEKSKNVNNFHQP